MSAQFATAINRLNAVVCDRLSGGQAITLAGAPVAAIYDNGYIQASVGLVGMASSQPSLMLKTSDVLADPVGAAVTVDAAAYLVAAHEPDGTGISRLLLESAT